MTMGWERVSRPIVAFGLDERHFRQNTRLRVLETEEVPELVARQPTNPLALAVLTLLSERPMHPYEMSATLRERQKEASIKLNYGSLYSVVESLQRNGLIVAQETVREGRRPERTIYALTDAGTLRMVDWLSELLSRPVKEYTQFEAALSLMPTLPPDDVVALLEQRLMGLRLHRQASQALLDQATEARFPRLFLIESEYTHALLDAEIAFVSRLVDELRRGEFSGVQGWRRLHELRDAGHTPAEIEAAMAEEFKEDFSWVENLTKHD